MVFCADSPLVLKWTLENSTRGHRWPWWWWWWWWWDIHILLSGGQEWRVLLYAVLSGE